MNLFKMTMLGLLVCCTSMLSAQEESTKKMKYGIGMALNYSKYHQAKSSFEIPDPYTPLMGFSLITTVEKEMSDRIKLSLRPQFSFLGSGVEQFETTFSQVNIDVPWTLHFRIFNSFYLELGAGAQYVAGMVVDDEFEGTSTITEMLDNRLLPSVHTGLSYVISDWVDIGIRYNHGLRSLFDIEVTDLNGNNIDNLGTTNRSLQFSIIIRHCNIPKK